MEARETLWSTCEGELNCNQKICSDIKIDDDAAHTAKGHERFYFSPSEGSGDSAAGCSTGLTMTWKTHGVIVSMSFVLVKVMARLGGLCIWDGVCVVWTFCWHHSGEPGCIMGPAKMWDRRQRGSDRAWKSLTTK